jgi:nucleosome binding factor SPN SPT16 subunit
VAAGRTHVAGWAQAQEQDDNYRILVELHGRLLKLIREGTRLSDLYAAAGTFLEESKPSLKEYLTKSLGFGVCIAAPTLPAALAVVPLS